MAVVSVAVLRINISKMSEGEHQFPFETEPADIGLSEQFVQKVRVQAVIEKSNRQVFLEVRASSGGLFSCDRCLDQFVEKLEAAYTILYVTENHAPSDDGGGREIQVISPDTNYIDLDEDVRQYLTLAIPQKLLCSDGCKGLCLKCGVNRNRVSCSCQIEETDPRWDTLKKFSGN